MLVTAACTWVWGADPDRNVVPSEGSRTHGKHNNVLNSTGAGAAYNAMGTGLNYTFAMETTDSGYGYQIRVARTSSGPWSILSSGSGTSTSAADNISLPGPLFWISPRVDAMASTANYVIIRMTAVE